MEANQLNMSELKVICFGEALIDKICNQTKDNCKNYLGGAPANVTCALSKLNVSSVFIGSVGNDAYGEQFMELFKKLKVDINFFQFNNQSSTRVVNVLINNRGERSFEGFENKGQNAFADELLDVNEIKKNILYLNKIFSEAKYIVTGTNILSATKSADSAFFLLDYAKRRKVKVVIDLNWRNVFWDNSIEMRDLSRKEQLKKIKKFLIYANLLKLAKEEACLFFDNTDPIKISDSLPNKPDVVITDGGNPIKWYIAGIKGQFANFSSDKIIDTTGAGDSFLSGLISQLLDIKQDQMFNKALIDKCIKFASVCGFLTCLEEGAIEPQPNFKEVCQFLES